MSSGPHAIMRPLTPAILELQPSTASDTPQPKTSAAFPAPKTTSEYPKHPLSIMNSSTLGLPEAGSVSSRMKPSIEYSKNPQVAGYLGLGKEHLAMSPWRLREKARHASPTIPSQGFIICGSMTTPDMSRMRRPILPRIRSGRLRRIPIFRVG